MGDQEIKHANQQKTRSSKSEEWSHTQFSWNCMHEWIKSRFKIIVTSYGRNKNFDNEIKNQEKANYSLSYRCAAINNKDNKGSQIRKMQFLLKK